MEDLPDQTATARNICLDTRKAQFDDGYTHAQKSHLPPQLAEVAAIARIGLVHKYGREKDNFIRRSNIQISSPAENSSTHRIAIKHTSIDQFEEHPQSVLLASNGNGQVTRYHFSTALTNHFSATIADTSQGCPCIVDLTQFTEKGFDLLEAWLKAKDTCQKIDWLKDQTVDSQIDVAMVAHLLRIRGLQYQAILAVQKSIIDGNHWIDAGVMSHIWLCSKSDDPIRQLALSSFFLSLLVHGSGHKVCGKAGVQPIYAQEVMWLQDLQEMVMFQVKNSTGHAILKKAFRDTISNLSRSTWRNLVETFHFCIRHRWIVVEDFCRTSPPKPFDKNDTLTAMHHFLLSRGYLSAPSKEDIEIPTRSVSAVSHHIRDSFTSQLPGGDSIPTGPQAEQPKRPSPAQANENRYTRKRRMTEGMLSSLYAQHSLFESRSVALPPSQSPRVVDKSNGAHNSKLTVAPQPRNSASGENRKEHVDFTLGIAAAENQCNTASGLINIPKPDNDTIWMEFLLKSRNIDCRMRDNTVMQIKRDLLLPKASNLLRLLKKYPFVTVANYMDFSREDFDNLHLWLSSGDSSLSARLSSLDPHGVTSLTSLAHRLGISELYDTCKALLIKRMSSTLLTPQLAGDLLAIAGHITEIRAMLMAGLHYVMCKQGRTNWHRDCLGSNDPDFCVSELVKAMFDLDEKYGKDCPDHHPGCVVFESGTRNDATLI